jgi:hypothetical protein
MTDKSEEKLLSKNDIEEDVNNTIDMFLMCFGSSVGTLPKDIVFDDADVQFATNKANKLIDKIWTMCFETKQPECDLNKDISETELKKYLLTNKYFIKLVDSNIRHYMRGNLYPIVKVRNEECWIDGDYDEKMYYWDCVFVTEYKIYKSPSELNEDWEKILFSTIKNYILTKIYYKKNEEKEKEEEEEEEEKYFITKDGKF